MFSEQGESYVFNRFFVYQVAVTLTVHCLISLALFMRTRSKRYKLLEHYGIPGPKPRLIDGNLHLYENEKAKFKIDQGLCRRYGKYYGVFICDEVRLLTNDPELLRKVFFEHIAHFKERATPFIESSLAESILFAPHNRWRMMRKIMSPSFSAYSVRGSSSTRSIETSSKLMLDYIQEKESESFAEGKKPGCLIDVLDLMKATALHTIANFAVPLPRVQVKECEQHVKSIDSYLESVDSGLAILVLKMPFLKGILSFMAEHLQLNATMASIHRDLNLTIDKNLEVLNRKCNSQLEKNLLNDLIRSYHEGNITRRELKGNIEAVLLAGYDTTSTTLSYILWILGVHLEVQEKLRGELMAYGIESEYLEQVIKESMRLYPTVSIFTTRLATKTLELDELTIPQGTTVVYNSWLLHKDPKLWPEPEKFDPERFRAGVEHHPCAFAPFGLGERRCLGFPLAHLQLRSIICNILMRYSVETISPKQLELFTHAHVLTCPSEKILINFKKL